MLCQTHHGLLPFPTHSLVLTILLFKTTVSLTENRKSDDCIYQTIYVVQVILVWNMLQEHKTSEM